MRLRPAPSAPLRLALAVLVAAATLPAAAVPFEISESYSASPSLPPGTYACRSGLDIDTFTYTFDIEGTGYSVRGLDDPAGSFAIDAEGTVSFASGPFAADDTATLFGRATRRVSDGNPVLILGYFFSDGSDSYDYCARLD